MSILHRRKSSQPKDSTITESAPGTGDREHVVFEQPSLEPSGPSIAQPTLKESSSHDISAPDGSSLQAPQHLELQIRASSPSVDRLGLSLVHSIPEPLADLIFVHGLGGSSVRTWSWQHDPSYFWPSWLAKDSELRKARIFMFGYNANFAKTDARSSVLEFARELLFRMKTYSGGMGANDAAIGRYPIVFVVHSMGGLVVKKAYVLGKSDEQYRDVVTRIRAVLFLATPHRGSAYADFLNNILRTTPTLSSKVYVSELEKMSVSLRDINEQFRTVCGNLELVSMYETQKTHLGLGIRKMIVDQDSAVLGYPTEISSGLNADHHGVCKFRAVDDQNYEQVRSVLRMFLKKLQVQEQDSPQTSLQLGAATPALSRTKLEDLCGIHDDPKADLDILRDKAMNGSCRWILDRKLFLSWRDEAQAGPKLLWLTGPPGVGKSILSSHIIDMLQNDPSAPNCCYHFFNSEHQSKRTVNHMLSSIAFQMALCCQPLAEKLVKLYDAGSLPIAQQNTKRIWESVFEGMLLRQRLEKPTFWIIDSLDEADNPGLFTQLLAKLGSDSFLRILIVSRPMKEMALHLLSINSAHDEITARDTQSDIQSYTDSALSSTHVLSKEVRDAIRDKVLEKAQGSFLWVTLVMEQLKDNWHTVGEIDRILNGLPEGMGPLYERMIHTISDQAARPREIASRILTWAVCSFHPLTLGELEVALSSEFGGFVSLESTVAQLCAGFVVVKGNRVALIHETARSFLLSRMGGQPLSMDPESGHEYIVRICLQFLMDKTKNWKRILASAQPSLSTTSSDARQDRRRPPLFDNHPFLSYAATCWAYHVSLALPHSREFSRLLHDFLDNLCLVWINAVALLGDMRVITRAAQYIRLFVQRREEIPVESPNPQEHTRDEALKQWSKDLIRVVGRYGDILLREPLSIHKHVAPFCPSGSMMHQRFATSSGLAVVGISGAMWDDCLTRLPLGTDEFATHIACTGAYVVAVTGHGVLTVWHAESCEQVRRLNHGEWVTVIACGRLSSLVATAGTKTIRVWNLTTGDEVYRLPKFSDRKILPLSFGKGDDELLVGYDDASIQCLELKPSEVKWDHAFEVPADAQQHCPHLVSFGPDHSHVLVVYSGKPMFAWPLDTPDSRPHVCIHPEDRLSNAAGERIASMWRAATPERIVWRPGVPSVFVLYNDATLFEWNIEDDILRQIPDIAALEMALSSDGNTLLTSNHNGVLGLWSVPQFQLIYELQETDIVRGLAFSPDGQRFYDIAGSLCSVWEPDALIRSNDLDRDQLFVSHDTSRSDPLSAMTVTVLSEITALVSDTEDRFYCSGNDSGAVVMHDTRTGKRVRKLYGHATIASVIEMAWSPTCQFIASADNCGRVIVKRLRKPTPENDTWGVYPLLDFRLGDAVLHLLFSLSGEYLLVASMGSTGVWHMRSRKRIGLSEGPFKIGTRWLNHPTNDALLLAISFSDLRVFSWDSLAEVGPDGTVITVFQGLSPGEPPRLQIANLSLKGGPSRAVSITATQVILESISNAGPQQSHTKRRNIMSVDIGLSMQPAQFKPLDDQLSAHLNRLIGTLQGHLVFLDHHYCFCTWNLRVGVASMKRHFHLPKDWLSRRTLELCVE